MLAKPQKKEDTGQVKKFFDHWVLYQKIVEHNYLRHREVYEGLHRFLIDNFTQPFYLIDLGCGDVRFMAAALEGTLVSCYEGIDLSEIALAMAQKYLKNLDCKKVFTCGDFCSAIKKETVSADILWIGLALHHLTIEQKGSFIGQCRKVLKPGGCMMIFDPVLKEHEDRNSFVERWARVCRNEWTALTPEEKDELYAHVAGADFPESLATYKKMGERHGFGHVRSLYQEPAGVYEMICFFDTPHEK